MESEGRAMREAVGRRGGRVKSWTSGLGIRGIFVRCSVLQHDGNSVFSLL